MAGQGYLAELETREAALDGPGLPGDPMLVAGTPLLHGPAAGPVIAEAARLLPGLAAAMARAELPAKLNADCRALGRELDCDPEAAERLVRAALSGEAPGIGAFLSWKALARALPPLDLSRWNRSDCPACGALPAMAQLRETGRGRERALVCGRCATRWSWRRIGCPYCENDAEEDLAVLEPAAGNGFRIDVCRRCNAYLKTYLGEGEPASALSDWSTLHLDAACAERGLQRRGPSLYHL